MSFCWAVAARAAKPVEAESGKSPDASTVAVAKATLEDLSRGLVLTAEFKPYQEVDVMAKVAGYVKEINVDVGDRVKEGQVLAILEIPEMADDRARAQAAWIAVRRRWRAPRTRSSKPNPRTISRT